MYEVHINEQVRYFEEYLREQVDGHEDFRMPTHKVVCPRCHGAGTHWPEAFSQGFTPEELDEWDDEEREWLIEGRYDVVCEECEGQNVVDEVDLERLNFDVKKRWQEWMASAYETHQIWLSETRMGA
jgi:hypothetical protein